MVWRWARQGRDMGKRKYLIYDGRAAGGDTDEASVCEVCQSLAEAKRNAPEYGDDCAVFSYAVEDRDGKSYLVDERFECVVGRG